MDNKVNEISNLIDKIYTGFILRDFFAKILPGLILILSFSFFLFNKFIDLKFLNSFIIILFFGLAWIIAFSIQSIGESFKLIKYWLPDEKDNWSNLLNECLSKSTIDEKSNCERLIVIKEASGNLAISLILSTIIVSARLLINNMSIVSKYEFWFAILFVFFIAFFLLKNHQNLLVKQHIYMKSIANKKRNN